MNIGYARIFTNEQTLSIQLDALRRAGCDRCFQDIMSGAKDDRVGLEAALQCLHPGDTLMVWKLDRLGRSLKHLIEVVTHLHLHDIGFVSLTEQWDTTTPDGNLIFRIFGALAEFERNVIRERTMTGLAVARARGRKGGRPAGVPAQKVAMAHSLYADPSHSITEICQILQISRATLYRYLDVAEQTSTPL
jgi:DNA invertase Pin-like site-specific DNA recombinase